MRLAHKSTRENDIVNAVQYIFTYFIIYSSFEKWYSFKRNNFIYFHPDSVSTGRI